MVTSIGAFVVVLGILIFFHEFGHFLIARLFGVGVEKFSLGFGPRLFGKKIGLTDYRISLIPLGGYVKMLGDEPGREVKPEFEHLSFNHKPVWQRSLIVAAGPIFNLILPILIFWGIFWINGVTELKPIIGEVRADSPAARVGIKPGDRILSVNDRDVESWSEVIEMIAARGEYPLIIAYSRENESQPYIHKIKPERIDAKNIFGEKIKVYAIGVKASEDYFVKKMSLFSALNCGLAKTYKLAKLYGCIFWKLITGSLSPKTLGGPIMIGYMAGQAAQSGFVAFLEFIAIISVNLGLINLLPIPILDGGHLMFFAAEAVRGRPVSLKIRERAQAIGFYLLIALMIYVFYNDIIRIFFK